MNDFKEIKDLEGNSHLAIKKNNYNEKDDIKDDLDYFEFLQKIGEGGFGAVYKVASKLNNKMYAMKIMDLNKLKKMYGKKACELAFRESKFLTVLSHPHIIKYYKNFQKDGLLYIIMENAENGDLGNLINAHKINLKHIPEKELWNIFLQCMQGLAYIHKMGVIHRDIKPKNILMDNNMNIKIGDFGTAAVKDEDNNDAKKYSNVGYRDILKDEKMKYHGTVIFSKGYTSPEMEKKRKKLNDKAVEYGQKVDVYSMGASFFELCYLHLPNEKLEIDDKINYSKEMLDIIQLMLEENPKKRKDSEFFLKKIQEKFSEKYFRNTSISSIMRCLYTFEDITDFYVYLKPKNIENKPITNAFVRCLKTFTERDKKKYIDSIKNFHETICAQNSRFDKTKELKPELILPFIIRQINNEANGINNLVLNANNNNDNNIITNHFIKTGEEFDETDENEMKINFLNKCFTQLNSYLSKKIMGLIKYIYKCEKCKMETYSFCAFFFINIDLENIINNKENPDIEDYIKYNNNIKNKTKKYCPNCLSQKIHEKNEKYDAFPYYLIIIIQRGKNSDNIQFRLKEELDLNKIIGLNGKKYKLVGFINRDKESENYVSFFEFKFPNSKKWFKCEKEEVKRWRKREHKDMFDDPNRQLIMAFYEVDS